jgi:hypothetical protein
MQPDGHTRIYTTSTDTTLFSAHETTAKSQTGSLVPICKHVRFQVIARRSAMTEAGRKVAVSGPDGLVDNLSFD